MTENEIKNIDPADRSQILPQSLKKDLGGRPREWSDEEIETEADSLLRWLGNKKNYYFLSWLNERKLHMEHANRFARVNEKFRATLQLAKATMEQRIVEGSMNKTFDGSFAKFVLANKAGWKEKTELSSDAANPFSVIMDRISTTHKDPIEIDITNDDK